MGLKDLGNLVYGTLFGGTVVPPQHKKTDGSWVETGENNPLPTQLTGSNVVEQKTQVDAVTGTVTFAENIQHLEIYNTDTVNDGVFNVNGINITVPKTESFKASYGGTPSPNVNVTGSTSYILTRYE